MLKIDTFAGFPACTDLSKLSADIAIIGIPQGTGYNPGEPSHSAQAPIAIRRAANRYAERIDSYDFDLGGTLLDNRNISVVDCGDLPVGISDPAGNRKRITENVSAILTAGAVPIVLGGDDSVPIPFFRAFQGYDPITIVQVDAHIDWCHEVNGVSEGLSSAMRRASEMPWIDNLIQVGIRGVGSAREEEVSAARAYGTQIITAKEVHDRGVEWIMDLIPEGKNCLLTLDCDGLDPSIMPAVMAPAPGGLSYEQVLDLLHGIAKKTNMVGCDLVEFVPEKDTNGLAALTAARIVFNMIGSLVRSRRFAKQEL